MEKGGEVDTLLDAESTWTGVRLSWWTFGRPSCELLDLAEKSWDGLVKAEKDLADVIAKVLPSTGAHTVTVERKRTVNTLTHVQTHTASPCSLAFTLQAALHACCAAAYIL